MAELSSSKRSRPPDVEGFPRPFGPYLLLESFARGGMGEVYLAKHGSLSGLERTCVVKRLRTDLTRDREYVARFVDEARVVNKLEHANICRVYDVGKVDDDYYLAMEYVAGRDVRTIQDRCRARGAPISPAVALLIVCETLEALDYAHRLTDPLTGEPLQVVHRDVSPQNILVSFEGEVKLIDFGLAASRLKVERTQPNVVMGKMAYMAPEQARGDRTDARADLFACAVLAYELLAGERFYEGMTANDIWQIAGKGDFRPARFHTLDPELQRHIGRALHADPTRRFSSCADFREALAAHLHHRHPGVGLRAMRDTMGELFADEIRKERERLARLSKMTSMTSPSSPDKTQSISVSLVRNDTDPPGAPVTLLGAAVTSTDEQLAVDDIVEDQTVREGDAATSSPELTVAPSRPPLTDATQRVVRAPRRAAEVLPTAPPPQPQAPPRTSRRPLPLMIAAAALVVGVTAWSARAPRAPEVPHQGAAATPAPAGAVPVEAVHVEVPAPVPAETAPPQAPPTSEMQIVEGPAPAVASATAPAPIAPRPAPPPAPRPDPLPVPRPPSTDGPAAEPEAAGLEVPSAAATTTEEIPISAQEQELTRLRALSAAKVVNEAVMRCQSVCIDPLDVQPTGTISDEDGERVRRCLVEHLAACPRRR